MSFFTRLRRIAALGAATVMLSVAGLLVALGLVLIAASVAVNSAVTSLTLAAAKK